VQVVPDFEGFEWDSDNREKNWRKHSAAWWECEELFFDQPLFFLPDPEPSRVEPRFYALGITSLGRPLFVVLMQRKKKICVTFLQLTESLLEGINVLGNRRDVPYQSMLKILLAEKVQESFGRALCEAVRSSGTDAIPPTKGSL
jgi:uncharacterized DUF497 family protein